MARQLIFKKCRDFNQDYFLQHPVLTNHISLLKKVRETFNPLDEIFFIKAPGRVNLIGEHTDYNMGPVLPCAINKEIVFAVRPAVTSKVQAINVDEKFAPVTFTVDQNIEPYSGGHWGNYIKGGIKGIIEHLNAATPQKIKQWLGFDIIVSSTLPQAAGVSSSSALLVAAALTFVRVNNLDLDKQKIAGICAWAEHFVGTAGGGMDQAASLLGKENAFLFMEFNPLRIKEIAAPEDIQLVLFNSLVQAEKSGKARVEYNRRVLECKMAVDLFNLFIQKSRQDIYKETNFIGEIKVDNFKISQEALDNHVKLFLDSLTQSYTLSDFLRKMDLTESELNTRYAAILKGGDRITEPVGGFQIKSRFKHVYYECRRVIETIHCLQKNDLGGLGHLINESHNSLSYDYNVSTAEVDELVRIIRDNGALGARIMGAGFGGMVLALTEISKRDDCIEKTKEAYYNSRLVKGENDFIFPCITADGADSFL